MAAKTPYTIANLQNDAASWAKSAKDALTETDTDKAQAAWKDLAVNSAKITAGMADLAASDPKWAGYVGNGATIASIGLSAQRIQDALTSSTGFDSVKASDVLSVVGGISDLASNFLTRPGPLLVAGLTFKSVGLGTGVAQNIVGDQTIGQLLGQGANTLAPVVKTSMFPDVSGVAYGAATSFLSLVKALQEGKPLPIVVAGVNTLALIQAGNGGARVTLTGTQNVLGAATSLYSLQAAWKQGDVPGVFAAGASTLTYGATAYANVLGYSSVDAAVSAGAISTGVGNAFGATHAKEHQFNSTRRNTELRQTPKMLQKQAANDNRWARAA